MTNFLASLLVPQPSSDDRDIALGQFMYEWGNLEMQLFFLFYMLIGTTFEIANTIFLTGFQSSVLSELLKSLGEIRLLKPEKEQLKSLCKRYIKAAQKRNKIVHGIWRIETNPDDSSLTEWVRIYDPINPTLQEQVADKFNQKACSNYRFTIKQLLIATENVKTLAHDIQSFYFAIIRLYPDKFVI